MKRLQLRHHDELFSSRDLALEFFRNILNPNHVNSEKFGTSLYAEPMVAKYTDKDGKVQILFAIGTDTPDAPYHIIDSANIMEQILANNTNIENEIKRAIFTEENLESKIEEEKVRAIEKEDFLNTKIENNLTSIINVNPSSENVREEYALYNSEGKELGNHIKIYKDSALVGAEVNFKGATGVTIDENGKFNFSYDVTMDKESEYLYLIYRNEKGELTLVALDFENFLMENEEGFGIKIIGHKITINIKSDEKYLKVTENGLQTINIDNTIEEYINIEKLRAEKEEKQLQKNIEAEINRANESENNLHSEIEKVKTTIDTFLVGADIGDAAIDTLKEIQTYITTDGNAAAKMTHDIALNNKLIKDEKARVDDTIKRVENIEDTVGDDSKGLIYKVNLIQGELDGLNGGVGSITTQIENALNALKLPETYASKSDFDTLVGEDTEKSARAIAAEEVAKVVASADSSFDTLKEIADYIANDITSAATLANTVSDLVAVSANTRLETIENIIYTTSGDSNVSIKDYILSLENRIKELENNIKNMTISTDQVKGIIREYLTGVDNEIKINETKDKSQLTIGFADDAIFG